jgi:Flp pilus assembly protein TadG
MSGNPGREKRKGITLLVTAALMAGVLPMVGLAIDASFLYTVKAKLSAAVDAAALAGARSLSRGMDLASQAENAKATAQAFFRANFPEGHLGTHDSVLTMEVAETALKTRTVQITGTVVAPSYFLRFLGIGNTTLKAASMASRRDVNIVLVLDRSTTMKDAMAPMKAAAIDLVNKFADGRDNIGLVVFGTGWLVPFPSDGSDMPQPNFKSASPNVATLINQMANGGSTDTPGALSKAYDMLKARNETGSLNLIVFFTDGLPNGVTGDFSAGLMKTGYGTTCTYKNDPTHPIKGIIVERGGIFDEKSNTLTSTGYTTTTKNANGCKFVSDYTQVGLDIARLPSIDVYTNQTNGPNRYVSADLTKVRDITQIDHASLNAADDAVQRIRRDTNLGVVIYAIGFANAVDETWMKRIANDPASVYYSSSVPKGEYVRAPTAADLSTAFAKVASEILRLAM